MGNELGTGPNMDRARKAGGDDAAASGRRRKVRIRDWKGLLHDEPFPAKARIFLALLVVSTSMTFTQFGFIGIGAQGEYLGYALGLLGPLSAAALMLGKGAGTLFGLISGAVLYAHARVQPLDLFERYLVSPLNSVVLYAFAGFLIGLLYAIALRNDPQGRRRTIYLAIACAVASTIVSFAFLINGFSSILISLVPSALESRGTGPFSSEWIGAVSIMKGANIQILFDFVLMLAVSLFVSHVVRKNAEATELPSVRTTFRAQLFVAAALVFCVVQMVSFVIVTREAVHRANEEMGSELVYLGDRLADELDDQSQLTELMEPYVNRSAGDASAGASSKADAYDSPETATLPAEIAQYLASSHGISEVLEGYDLKDGTVLILKDDTIVKSYNPAYQEGTTFSELFDPLRTGRIEELADSERLQDMLYRTQPSNDLDLSEDLSSEELGYMRARKSRDYVIVLAKPSSMIFSHRESTMSWATVTALALLATVYLLADRLLRRGVAGPIDRTNESLAKITTGDLGEIVTEQGNREFASLSNGINQTVGSLRNLISEAERRNKQDLAIAKRIQESALPRAFPPFPEIGAFDIFAAMDPAKEVGGDFFDFFLIDDNTLGFLIADVSGKGIPGALFMMAAKAEIENYLSTGMDPAEAIASANRRLCANNDAGMFVTVWAATLDWRTGLLTYVNAGHNFPLLRHGREGSWEWLKKKCGLFLGTFETAKYRQETISLEPGDELLLYTDGVNEAFSPTEEEYGNDRLEAFLERNSDMHPRELVRSLRSDVARWADGAEQSDDVTILALEYGVAPEVTGSLTVPATLDHLDDAMGLVTGELERRLCPIGVQRKVEVALEELFVNVCRHAYAEAASPGNITVSYAYGADPSSITVELRDHGVPFDPVAMDDPTKPSSIQEAKVGGLGILMVKRSMDDLAYLREHDANVVVFKKGW